MSITYGEIKKIVEDKLVNKTEKRSYEDLSELLFGEGNCFNESEVRKRMYGMKRIIEVIESDNDAVATRILSISDAHVPFHLPIDMFKSYSGRVDVLIFNGDIEDCFACSAFPRKFRASFDEEMVEARKYMVDVINMIAPKKVIITMGNHEYRLGRHLTERLSEDIMTIMPDSPLELIVNHGFRVRDRLNKTETYYAPLTEVFDIPIQYNGDWFCKVGNVIFAHPLSYSSGMLKTAEKAVDYFLRVDRTFTGLVMAHTHKIGSYVQGDIKLYEQGCVCDLDKLDYNNGKLVLPSQNGFLYMCLDKEGNIIDNQTKLITTG